MRSPTVLLIVLLGCGQAEVPQVSPEETPTVSTTEAEPVPVESCDPISWPTPAHRVSSQRPCDADLWCEYDERCVATEPAVYLWEQLVTQAGPKRCLHDCEGGDAGASGVCGGDEICTQWQILTPWSSGADTACVPAPDAPVYGPEAQPRGPEGGLSPWQLRAAGPEGVTAVVTSDSWTYAAADGALWGRRWSGDVWENLGPLGHADPFAALGVAAGRLYQAGGEPNSVAVHSAALDADGRPGVWRVEADLPLPRSDFALLHGGDWLVALGGELLPAGGPTPVAFTTALGDEGVLAPWDARTTLHQALGGPSATIQGDRLWVVGEQIRSSLVVRLPDFEWTDTLQPPWASERHGDPIIPDRVSMVNLCEGLLLGVGEGHSLSAEVQGSSIPAWFVAPPRYGQTANELQWLVAGPDGQLLSLTQTGDVAATAP